MYFKKANLLKFILGFWSVLAGIIVLVFIIGENNPVVQKHTKTSQEEFEIPDVSTHLHKNRLKADRMTSYQEKRVAEMSNMEQSRSRIARKIAALESSVNELRSTLQSAVENDFDGNAAQDSAAGIPEMEEEEIMSQIKAQIDMMQETLLSEPIDAEWSDSAINALYESIQKNSSGGFKILNTDFRSTLCRIDLTLDTAFPEAGFREFQDLIPWNGEMFFQVDDINSGEAVVYIAREDYSLPRQSE